MAIRVLLADDSATVQKTVSLMLADEGIEVMTASDGNQARRLLDSGGADLVIAGLSLPEVTGYELCRYIKSSRCLRGVPVILLVGVFEQLDQMEALRAGADAQLSKPPQSRALIQTVRKLIEKNGHANRASFMPVTRLEEASEGPRRNEQPKQQSVFFKPYMPPPNLTADSLSLEVRALPARVEPTRLDRKPSRVPEGGPVIVMTALAILVALGLVLWLAMRPSKTVLDSSMVAQQTAAIEAQPAAPGPAASSSDETTAGPEDDSHSATQLKSDDGERHQTSTAPARGQQSGRAGASFNAPPSPVREQMLARARAYEERGMMAQAELHYRAVLHNFPGDETSRAAINRLQSRMAAERYQESSRLSRDAGLRSFRSGDYSSAVTGLTAALNAGRGDTVVLYSLGMSQWKLGRNREAQSAFERCLVANPGYAPAIVGLAQVKAAEGKRAEAIALLHRALQLGGGAEFTPERIREMLSRYQPPASRP
jgi:DNA-binding response OmpR family regulator